MDYLKNMEELGLGSRLSRLSDRLMREIQQVYSKLHISFDPRLFPVFNLVGTLRQSTTTEISLALQVSQPSVTQMLQKLEKRGLVQYGAHALDKRKKQVELTGEGIELRRRLQPLWNVIKQSVREYACLDEKRLIDQLNEFENILNQKPLSTFIMQNYALETARETKIIDFKPEYSEIFRDLNLEWLQKFFVVEPYDAQILENSQEDIVDKGGFIFLAAVGSEIAGCYALIKKSPDVFELSKMAVSPKFQGYKIGQKLMAHGIEFATHKKWKKLILYSNTKLENAIYIYQKFGFKEVALEKGTPYLRSNIKMEFKIQ